GHRVLSPAGVTAMTTLATGTLTMDGTDALGYGLGFTVVRTAAGQNTLKPIGAFGHTGAFGTEFWGDRERGIVAVYLAQGLGNPDPARKTFDTMVNAAYVGTP
ncbi:class A beta-lactamase-related serine hydrolase, partial [bacterium]